MYIIKDIVETAHSKFTGGSIEIEFVFKEIIDNPQKYLNIIDYLDHCIVTDNKKYLQFTTRYFLINSTKNFFEDLVGVLSEFIDDEVCSISIIRNKEKFTTDCFKSNVVDYCIEG